MTMATGYWNPAHGGGWQWVAGQNPPQYLIDQYGLAAETNPAVDPSGVGPANPPDTSAPESDTPTPQLTQIWATAPHIPGDDPDDTLNGSPGSAPGTPSKAITAFAVSPGSIEEAENTILAETQTAVTAYDAFREKVQSEQGWAFSINNPGMLTETVQGHPTLTPGNLPNQDATNQFIIAQDQALRGAGDAIELAGKYVAWLNDAAQAYGATDLKCFLPPPITGDSRRPAS
jgi:hypothetical protein